MIEPTSSERASERATARRDRATTIEGRRRRSNGANDGCLDVGVRVRVHVRVDDEDGGSRKEEWTVGETGGEGIDIIGEKRSARGCGWR